MQDDEGTYSEVDESGYYWTSTEYDNHNAEYFSYLIIDTMPVVDISRKSDIADIPREGIVVRNYEKNISFKVINPDFLLKYNE